MIFGTAAALMPLPGTFALTSLKFSSAGSFLKLSGSAPAGVQAPFRSVVLSHVCSSRR